MRGNFIGFALASGFHVIGQVRKDTALFCVPEKTRKRGRPKKYGEKYTPKVIEDLPQTWIKLFVYGKRRRVRYRSVVIAKARFLKCRLVHAVWSAIEDDDDKIPQGRLILSTDLSLPTTNMIMAYARRGPIENMFHHAKNSWGWKETWQPSRQVLHRWLHIFGIGFALPQLLDIRGGKKVSKLADTTPWRKKHPITAGQLRSGLVKIFVHFPVRDWWNVKY